MQISATRTNEKGKKDGGGSLEYAFSADKFGPPPACDPNRKPTFRLDKNLAAEDESSEGEAKGRSKGGFKLGKPAQPGGE